LIRDAEVPMKLSHASGYAVQALVSLAAHQGGGLLASHDAAEAHGMSELFLPKVLKPLVRGGILFSKKGRGGGYGLARPPQRITLLEVVEAVDGPLGGPFPQIQGTGTEVLERRLRQVCEQVNDQIRKLLGKVTLAQLAGTGGRRGEG
jgi:Rrf2 family protein